MSTLLMALFGILFGLSIMVVAWWMAYSKGWKAGYLAAQLDELARVQQELFDA